MTAAKSADLPSQPIPAAAFLAGLTIRPERADDAAAVEALHAAVFGPGRFARTAFRLREGVPHDPALSLVALKGDALVGAVRLTPMRIGATPALLLGPLCVRPELKNLGVGKTLMRRSMEAARVEGHRLVLLVGDLPYYWPFGFRAVPGGAVTMPGPVDPARLLWAELVAGASDGVRGDARGG